MPGAAKTRHSSPLGDATPQAAAAVETIEAKVAQYFLQCDVVRAEPRLEGRFQLDDATAGAFPVTDAQAIEARLKEAPLAPPRADGLLPAEATINPWFADAFKNLRTLALAPLGIATDAALSRERWNAALQRLATYRAWRQSKQEKPFDAIGEDKIRAYLTGDLPARLETLIASDLAAAPEIAAIDRLERFLLLLCTATNSRPRDPCPAIGKKGFDASSLPLLFIGASAAFAALLSAFTYFASQLAKVKILDLIGIIGSLVAIAIGVLALLGWLKLRARDLAPVLEANGWAVNSRIGVNGGMAQLFNRTPALPAGALRLKHQPAPARKPRSPFEVSPARLFALLLLAGIACFFVFFYVFYPDLKVDDHLDAPVAAADVTATITPTPTPAPESASAATTVLPGADALGALTTPAGIPLPGLAAEPTPTTP